MIKSRKNITKGIKGSFNFYETKSASNKYFKTIDTQERIKICLSCTKPAKECKGNCFGRSN
jgi:hypothetical protein